VKKFLLALVSSRVFRKGLLFLLLCGLFGLALSSSSMFDALNEQWIDLHIRNNGLLGVFYFMLICALATSVGCPRQLVAFLGGYTFGAVNGVVFSTLGVTLGCMLTLFVARVLIRPLINRHYPHRVIKVNQFLAVRPVVKTIIIRLLPIGNNMVTNLVAGVTAVKARYFILGSFVGYIPQMVIFALMGKGVVVMSAWKIGLSIVLFFVSAALSARLYRQYRAERLMEIEREHELGAERIPQEKL